MGMGLGRRVGRRRSIVECVSIGKMQVREVEGKMGEIVVRMASNAIFHGRHQLWKHPMRVGTRACGAFEVG